jgi:hypothetical protein
MANNWQGYIQTCKVISSRAEVRVAVVNPVAMTARQSRSLGIGLVVVKLPNT